MTITEIQVLLSIVGCLVAILLGILAWIGKDMVSQLKRIATSVQKIEVEFATLSNDHSHLKKEVEGLQNDFRDYIKRN